MYLGYQNGKIKFYTETKLDTALYNIDKVEETQDEYVFDGEEYVLKDEAWEEKQTQKERERLDKLLMTPLDFIKALEQFAGITYDQIKKLCDAYPEIDRELRFCQNVYRCNPMFSEEALSRLPKEFHLTQEQIDNLFVAVDNMKKDLT